MSFNSFMATDVLREKICEFLPGADHLRLGVSNRELYGIISKPRIQELLVVKNRELERFEPIKDKLEDRTAYTKHLKFQKTLLISLGALLPIVILAVCIFDRDRIDLKRPMFLLFGLGLFISNFVNYRLGRFQARISMGELSYTSREKASLEGSEFVPTGQSVESALDISNTEHLSSRVSRTRHALVMVRATQEKMRRRRTETAITVLPGVHLHNE